MIPESDVVLTDMQKVANAFAFLTYMRSLNGRRLQRAYELSRMRVLNSPPDSPMLTAQLAPRAMRREYQLDKFRPIYGYRGCSETYTDSFRDTIEAMRVTGKTKKKA